MSIMASALAWTYSNGMLSTAAEFPIFSALTATSTWRLSYYPLNLRTLLFGDQNLSVEDNVTILGHAGKAGMNSWNGLGLKGWTTLITVSSGESNYKVSVCLVILGHLN